MRKKNNVLFVDDEINILNSLKRITLEEEYFVLVAASGEKALKLFEEYEISVIVADMKMPGMNGLDLLKKVKEISPNTIRIILSGYAQLPQILATVNSVGLFRYITKPWDGEEDFLPSIREGVDYYNAKRDHEKLVGELEKKTILYKNLLDTNQSIMAGFEKDMLQVKKIFQNLLNMQRYLVHIAGKNQISLEEMTEYIESLDKNFVNFLGILPTLTTRFSIGKLKEDFDKKLGDKLLVSIKNDGANFTGNYKGISLVAETLVSAFKSNCDELKLIKLNLVDEPSFQMIFEMQGVKLSKFKEENLYMKLLLSLVNEFCIFIGSKMVFESDEIIKIDFQTK